MSSDLEAQLLFEIRALDLPEPECQYQFDASRRRLDFAWPARKLCCEVQGGTWKNGRHTRGGGYQDDAEKLNDLALAGWTVVWFTGDHVRSGYAVALLERVLRRAA